MTCDAYAPPHTGVTVHHMNLLVLDLACLRFHRTGDELAVHAPDLGELARCRVAPGTSDREAVFQVLDEALAVARIPTSAGSIPVGLYNPLSAEIAIGAVPDTESFTDTEPITLAAYGTIAEYVDGVVHVDGRTLRPVTATVARVAVHLNRY